MRRPATSSRLANPSPNPNPNPNPNHNPNPSPNPNGYFKQALLECDEEWSQHKKLYTTKGSVRGVVPPGFAYFDVAFGLQEG